MLRWARILLLSLLLLVSLSAAGIWWRSRTTADTIYRTVWVIRNGQYFSTSYSVMSGRGVIGLSRYMLALGVRPAPSAATKTSEWGHGTTDAIKFELPEQSAWEKLGFGELTVASNAINIDQTTVVSRSWWMPYWFLVLITGIAPIWSFIMSLRRWRRRRKRLGAGLCVNCGYDLRATTDRCPECGATKTRKLDSQLTS